ncbi:MAG TPA: ABC transporter ATP-binding protein [Pyrinomonadaceae bacterium]|jgi:ABC-type Fe3+/spermidine/putrescine transport system ATPase subunit
MSLKVSNLSKKYDDKWILKDVSFEARPGQVTGVFGATSAGKTTLIRILSGKENCSGGEIFEDARDVSSLSCEERGFHLPNLKNDSFWKSLFKTNNKSELSDGDGQILALEQSLNEAEGILLLDDTFCFMDRQKRDIYFARLREVTKEKNLTVIFATNDFEEVFAACDAVAILAKGEIQQTGAPREIYENPANARIADITGKNNLIIARRLTSNKAELPEFQTLVGEHHLFTARTEKHSLGALTQNVCLAIRPEHISISFGASFPEDNLLKATIAGINYKGATTLIKLDADGLFLEALVLRLVGLNLGDECMVGLPPDRVLVLKD